MKIIKTPLYIGVMDKDIKYLKGYLDQVSNLSYEINTSNGIMKRELILFAEN